MSLYEKKQEWFNISNIVSRVRNLEAINEAVETASKKGLILKLADGLQDYLSCEMKFSEDIEKS